ncbi:ATP-binding protein [Niveispirillum fermenti]|uniref:ATP-binding protein n=1 Tax=Niveispirillum fermenti TaxID=1233113 RepID=UPI004042BC80
MRWEGGRPVRFVIIGVALVGPTAAILLSLLLAGHVDAIVALPVLLVNIAVAAAVLRMIQTDTRRLTDYADRLAETPAPLSPPAMASTAAKTIAAALARAHQDRLDRESRDRARAVLVEAVIDQLHDPVILLGAGREVQRANKAARDLFGDRILARDLASTVRTPSLLEAADAVLAGGASRTVEVLLPVPVERTLQARVKPFRPPGQDGGLLVLLSLHDITVLKRSEQMRADFVANASHELRTPLAALIGFIETLRGPAKDDRAAHERFLGIMFEQSNRMSRLVNDLLSLSRIEMDEHSPPTAEVDVGKIVRNVAATLELRAASRKVKLRLDQPDSLPAVVGDEDQLAQVFQNLIDNAIKYGKEQTEVTVTLSARPSGRAGTVRGPAVTVAVADRGDGIARTHLPRLTEQFYRVDPARSRALGGTGLGLAIVKHIVNRHRGRLVIDSEVGKGSTFTVVLPAAGAAAAERRDAG